MESKWVVLTATAGAAALGALGAALSRRTFGPRTKRHTPVDSCVVQELSTDAIASRQPRFVVEIEYCTRCRWMLRAAWLAQEVLTTFQPSVTETTSNSAALTSVVLTPNAQQGGIFDVTLRCAESDDEQDNTVVCLWSRKQRGRFPESKELKQLVRDHICPDKSLGHSDRKE